MLLIYFVIFFTLCFVLPSLRVYRLTGKNPITFKTSDSAHDLIGFYMKLLMLSALLSGVFNSRFVSVKFEKFVFFDFQETAGSFLMIIALLWVIAAQVQMSSSWRIGIDEKEKTKMVTNGLFGFSRNPIFLGMLVSLFGVLLLDFSFLNGINFLIAFILITIQIRLEEEFLLKMHSDEYRNYKKRTPRWL